LGDHQLFDHGRQSKKARLIGQFALVLKKDFV